MSGSSGIDDLLLKMGVLDDDALIRAKGIQYQEPMSLGKALARLGLSTEEETAAAIAKGLQLEALGSTLPEVSADAVALLPAEFCKKRKIVPLAIERNTLRLAMADPLDLSIIQDVEFRTSKRVVAVVASETDVETLLQQIDTVDVSGDEKIVFRARPEGEIEAVSGEEFELSDPAKLAKDTKMPPVIRLVNLILSGAAKEGASDIHLEPKESYLQVRQRVDGLLHEVMKIPKGHQDPVVSRLKILSGMDIAERRRPQDGRSRLRFEGKRIDLRLSTLPTQFGEKAVIRLLDRSKAQIKLDEIDFTPPNLLKFQSLLSRPQGMILVTGPTGSGKTSTLYSALNWVKSSTKNIITVEDPIEYQLDGVNQVQINTKAGITFAAGLRSILRQDPNVILVGEIRDQETAGIALEAAQTGHLLLSTVHTNDASSTISRLLDLGIEPFLISSALIGILAQRLMRRPCPSCSVPQMPKPDTIEKVGGPSRLPAETNWVAGRGCLECKQSGYKGRLAVHELLKVNDEIRDLITRRASDHAIRKAARSAGMCTLLEDGIRKAAQGLTTLEEVVRIVGLDDAVRQKELATKPTSSDKATGGAIEVGSVDLADSAISDAGQLSDGKETVLVVEDSRTIQSVVKYFLELEGFAVLLAKDGTSGLEIARTRRPHVIITDYYMPGMDGIALVKELRADPLTQSTAVLMLTSEDGVDNEAHALAMGADDYVVKPVEPRRLAARVKALLTRSITK
jgi:type IV pilus assembly protein PilB